MDGLITSILCAILMGQIGLLASFLYFYYRLALLLVNPSVPPPSFSAAMRAPRNRKSPKYFDEETLWRKEFEALKSKERL